MLPVATGRAGSCLPSCGACCTFLELNVNPDYLRVPDAAHWVKLHGITLREEAGAVYARIPLSCSALTADKRCGLYGTPERPILCSVWPTKPLDLVEFGEVCGYSFPDSLQTPGGGIRPHANAASG